MSQMNTQQPCSSSDIPITSSHPDASTTNSLVNGLLKDCKYQGYITAANKYIKKIDNATATENEVIVQVLVAYRNKDFKDVKFYLSTNEFSQRHHAVLRNVYWKCYERSATRARIQFEAYCPLSIAEKRATPFKIFKQSLQEVFNRMIEYPDYKINFDMLSRLTTAPREQILNHLCLRLVKEKDLDRWTYGLSFKDSQLHVYPINGSDWSHPNFWVCEGLLDEDHHDGYMQSAEVFFNRADKSMVSDIELLILILTSYRLNDFDNMKRLIEKNFFRPSNQEALRELYSRCHRKCVGENNQSMNGNFNFPFTIAHGRFSNEAVPEVPSKLPPSSVVVRPAKVSKNPGSSGPSGSPPLTCADLAIMELIKHGKKPGQRYRISKNVQKRAEQWTNNRQTTIGGAESSSSIVTDNKKGNEDLEVSSERSNQEVVPQQKNVLIGEQELSNDVILNAENDMLADIQPPEMEQAEAVEQEILEAENQEREKLMEVGRPSRTRKRTQPYESKEWRKYPSTPKTSIPAQKRGRGRPRKRLANEDEENEPSMEATLDNAACSSSMSHAPLPEIRRNYQPRQEENVRAQEPPRKHFPCYYSWLRSDDAKPVEKRARLSTQEEVQDIEQGVVEHSTDYIESLLNQVNNVPNNLELNDAPQNLALLQEKHEIAEAPENNEVQDEPNIELPVEESVDISMPIAFGNYEVMFERFAPIQREVVEEVVQPQVVAPKDVHQAQSSPHVYEEPALDLEHQPIREVKMEVDDDQVVEVVDRPPLENVESVAAQAMIPNAAAPLIPDPSLPPRCGENYMLWTIEEMGQWIMAVSKSKETRDIFKDQGMDGESMGEFLCEQVQKDLNIMYFPWRKLARAAQLMIDNKPQ